VTSSLGAQASFDLANAAASAQQQNPHHNTHHGQGMLFSSQQQHQVSGATSSTAGGVGSASNHHMNHQLTSPTKPMNHPSSAAGPSNMKVASANVVVQQQHIVSQQ